MQTICPACIISALMKWILPPDERRQATVPKETNSVAGCGSCRCRSCMLWWSGRCPHGECYDDFRAKEQPYNEVHPNLPPRTGWSNWKQDQAYWCRGGVFYPQSSCEHYVPYEGSKVKSCLEANVQMFQDGYIQCSIVDSVGCAECYKRLENSRQRLEGA